MEVLLFTLKNCPHCVKAFKLIEELVKENPAYLDIKINDIDECEQEELANSYDYYYVPTFYVDGVKLHEGVVTKEDVQRVLEAVLKK